MTGTDNKTSPSTDKAKNKDGQEPEWASGLKQLYNSVVNEPLPDNFKDLLAKLDDGDK
ncbi:NepR family anti-sigma factor [Altericroceibacterium spongiae]|nr:NepR family anti-sigma factor [Altericroceibacterium spongiae]